MKENPVGAGRVAIRARCRRECGKGARMARLDGLDPVVRLTIPARPEYITLCRLALTGLSRMRPLSDETLADLKLALTEACSNSVRHAYPEAEGHVEIVYTLTADVLQIV